MKVVWDIFVDAMFLISTGFGSILIVFGLLYLFKVLLY